MRYIAEFAAFVRKPIQPITLSIKDRQDREIQSIYIDAQVLGDIRKAIRSALGSQPIFQDGRGFYDKRIISTPKGDIDTEYVALMPNNITVLYRIVYKALAEGHVVDNSQDLLDYIEKNRTMFWPSGRFFWSLYTTTSGKKQMGDATESEAEAFFMDYAESKGINVLLRKPDTREADALEGEDYVFDHNGKVFSIQVKTLDAISEVIEDGVAYYKVNISGDYTELWNPNTKKGVDYLVVMSVKQGYPSYIFRAKGSITGPDYYLVPTANFVHKADISQSPTA